MPSTNMLASHKSSKKSRHHVRGSIAKFLLSFCGLASFGVVTTLIALSSNTVYAESNSNTITANLPGSVAIRLLNAEGTAEISSLDFNNLTPTSQGTTASKSFIVDVATSNPTGYKLYMQSDYQDSNNNYTTNLTHTDADVTDSIPTSTTSGSKVYWNYVNPFTSTTSPIPAYGQPDQIGQNFTPTESNQSTVGINVGIDTTIVSGTYENQLLFSAVGNPNPVSYSIDFDTDGGSSEPTTIESTATSSTFSTTIPSTIPEKTGYTFNYWDVDVTEVDISSSNGTRKTRSSTSRISDATAICKNPSTGEISTHTDPDTKITNNVCNPGDTLIVSALGEATVEVKLAADYTINQYTLTVKPNGGTWDGDNSDQSFTQDYNTTKEIPDLSANAAYNVIYNDNGQSATFTPSSMSVNRDFLGWNLTGSPSGSAHGIYDTSAKNYTFGVGDDTLSAEYSTTSGSFTLPVISKDHHNCKWAEGDPSGTQYDGGTTKSVSSDTTYYAICNIIRSTLTVDPNGGTWSGSTSTQSFTQDHGSTKSISNPTANPTYSITYNANSQGASYTGSPTSVSRPFSSWALSGGGTFAGGSYTYGDTNGTLTAQYDTASSSFTLPAISKTGYTCYWASDTAGTKYGDGGESKTTSTNLTLYAYCSLASYLVSISNSNTTSGASYLYIPYGGSKTVTVTPNSGYKLSSVTCPSGYTCSGYSSGSTGQQTVTVTNNKTASGGTLKFVGASATPVSTGYTVSISASKATVSSTTLSIPYGGSKTITVTPDTYNYLFTVACPTGYTCSGYTTGPSYTGKQTITIKNNNTASGGTVTVKGSGVRTRYTVVKNNITCSTSSATAIYGYTNSITVTPKSGYYLSSVSCSSNLQCSGYKTGKSYTGAQTIKVKTVGTVDYTLSGVTDKMTVTASPL